MSLARVWGIAFAGLLLLANSTAHAEKLTRLPDAEIDYFHLLPGDNPQSLPALSMIQDPLEPVNRVSFIATDFVFRWVLDPVLVGYRAVVPLLVRRHIAYVDHNIQYPIRFFSCLGQARWNGSVQETGRFLVNSTLGIAGIFDFATPIGLGNCDEDFGQTFARWGWRRSRYVFLPLLGPSTGRDTLGEIFNTAFDPSSYITYVLPLFVDPWGRYVMADTLMRANSLSFLLVDYPVTTSVTLDPYTTFRDLWILHRLYQIDDQFLDLEDAPSDPVPTIQAVGYRNTPGFARKFSVKKVPLIGLEASAPDEKSPTLPVSFLWQKGSAPLVVLVPGVGSSRHGLIVNHLAEHLYRKGYSVATVASALNWEFIRHASTVSVPGYTPDDVRDVERALSSTLTFVESTWPGRSSRKILLGLSLGGLHVSRLAAEDRLPQFDRMIAIGGPLDPAFAIRKLDQYYNSPLQWPEEERLPRVQRTIAKAFAVRENSLGAERKIPLDETESSFLVGLHNRASLTETLAAIYFFKGRDRFERLHPPEPGHERDLTEFLRGISFERFMEEIVLPSLSIPAGEAEKNAALYGMASELKRAERFRSIVTRDEILFSPNDLPWLSRTLGDRVSILETGGHLGNLDQTDFQEALDRALLP